MVEKLTPLMIDVVFVFATLDPVQHCMISPPPSKKKIFLVDG